jgi:hypothetical protein
VAETLQYFGFVTDKSSGFHLWNLPGIYLWIHPGIYLWNRPVAATTVLYFQTQLVVTILPGSFGNSVCDLIVWNLHTLVFL